MLQHDAPVPPCHIPPPVPSEEIAQLHDDVTDLKNQVQVLSDILDEIREELQWITRNGLPIRELMPTCPTLRRMAVDPCAQDWGDRLIINYGEPTRTAETGSLVCEGMRPIPSASSSGGKPPSGKLFAEAGDQRRLF